MPQQEKNLAGIVTANLDAADISADNFWQAAGGTLELKGWHGSLTVPKITVNNMELQATMQNGRLKVQAQDILLTDFNTESPLKLKADLRKNEPRRLDAHNNFERLIIAFHQYIMNHPQEAAFYFIIIVLFISFIAKIIRAIIGF